MNEFKNGFSALPDGFSAVSVEEADQIEGGGWLKKLGLALLGVAVGYVARRILDRPEPNPPPR
jgi:hypothetical protein